MNKLIAVFIGVFMICGFSYSQKRVVNVDSIFSKAILYAKDGDYTKALADAQKAYIADSSRSDILVYMANVYSWKAKNDTALLYIHKALSKKYTGNDLYEAWTNILYRQHKYSELLFVCDEAEKMSLLTKGDLLQKRLTAYTNLKEYEKGIALAKEPSNSKLINTEPICTLYNNLLIKSSKEMITFNYIKESFDSIASQHIASLGYYTKLGEHTLGINLNYANRFSREDVQLESDFYLQMKNNRYLYLNYGYSFHSFLFPKQRFGVEYYFSVSKNINASLGARYMNYQKTLNPNLFIITGQFEKSFGKSIFSIRPYYVMKKDQQSLSVITNYKRFGNNDREYWGLTFGFGNTPDEIYTTQQSGGFNQLAAYVYKIEKSLVITRLSDLHLQLGYTCEQYNALKPGIFRNRYTFELGYKIHFR